MYLRNYLTRRQFQKKYINCGRHPGCGGGGAARISLFVALQLAKMSMADGLNPQIVTAVEEVSAKAFALKKIAHVGVYDTLVSIKQQADREKEETEKRKTNMGTRNNSATDMTSMNDKEEDDEKIPEDTADPNKVKVTMEQKEMLLVGSITSFR